MEDHDAAWTPALASRAARVRDGPAAAFRRERIAAIIRDAVALHRLVSRWDTFVAHCVRGERHPQIMARDPERIDAALIELRATAALIPGDVCPRIHRTLAELEGIAARTRVFRQQCALAPQRAPADA